MAPSHGSLLRCLDASSAIVWISAGSLRFSSEFGEVILEIIKIFHWIRRQECLKLAVEVVGAGEHPGDDSRKVSDSAGLAPGEATTTSTLEPSWIIHPAEMKAKSFLTIFKFLTRRDRDKSQMTDLT